MSCTLASLIENPWPVTVCNPDDNLGRRIRSDEKRQNCGFEFVAMEIINEVNGQCRILILSNA